MKIKAQKLAGFRDFLPEEARLRESVITTLKEVFALYGFSPLETPAIEYAETLLDKYGTEADKLIYLFKDRGGREVGLRYDPTVPLARVVASYQNELPIPFRRYQVGPVWRAEKPQSGRYREFWQADIDTVGSSSPLSDAEIITCVLTCADRLGFADYKLFINDRRFLDALGVTPELAITIDKKDKVGLEAVFEELAKKTGEDQARQILQNLKKAVEPESIKKIKSLISKMDLDAKRVVFNPWLSRGLEYYTGPIFELKVSGYENLSVGGGGRYDELVGKFAGRDLPAVGFSFGIDRVIEALKTTGTLLETKGASSAEVLVTVFDTKTLPYSLPIATKLRQAEISTEVYPDEETKLDKQLKYADKKGVEWVVIIGPDEIKGKTVTVKNMQTGEQKIISDLNQWIKSLG